MPLNLKKEYFKVFIEFVTILLLFLFFFSPEAYEILVSQPGIEPIPLRWKVKSQPLDHQGNPYSLRF